MSTVEQGIVSDILTNLQSITITNGYTFDANVFEWKDTPLTAEELPGIIVRDKENLMDEEVTERQLVVDVLLVDSGDSSPSSVRQKKQDILTAFSAIVDFDGVAGAKLLSTEMSVEKEPNRKTICVMTFSVDYVCEVWTI